MARLASTLPTTSRSLPPDGPSALVTQPMVHETQDARTNHKLSLVLTCRRALCETGQFWLTNCYSHLSAFFVLFCFGFFLSNVRKVQSCFAATLEEKGEEAVHSASIQQHVFPKTIFEQALQRKRRRVVQSGEQGG